MPSSIRRVYSDMSTVSTRIPRYRSKNGWSTIEPAMPIETPPSDRYDLPRRIAVGEAGAREAQDLRPWTSGGIVAVARVLHVAAVDAERRQALLGVRREHRREVDRAGPLGAVEAPDRLGRERVHVHRLGPVAPAGRDRDRDADALEPEQLRDLGRLVHAADVVVGDDDLDRRPVRVAQRWRG